MIAGIKTSLPTTDLDHVLAHTEGLWEDLRGQGLFLTGGTGFVGMWLVESFAAINARLGLNASACILTRNPAAAARRYPWLAANPALRYHAGDIGSFEFPAGEFSHVIHAATENDSVTEPLDPIRHFDANVHGTRRVLEFARQSGARRVLFTSSGAVYGKQPVTHGHIPEDFNGAPSILDLGSTYAHSKRISEFLCAAAARKGSQSVTMGRLFAFVGPYLKLDANFAIGNFIRDAMRGGPLVISGDGTPLRSYLYAADMAVWLWTILLRGQNGRAYNVGSDEAVSIAQLAQRVAAVVAPGAAVNVAQKADPNRLPPRFLPDISRARYELGLEVRVSVDDAIDRTARWHQTPSHESL